MKTIKQNWKVRLCIYHIHVHNNELVGEGTL